MAPRKRSKSRQSWPKYLTHKDIKGRRYYFWKDPRSGKQKTLGCPNDLKKAKSMVESLNALLAVEKNEKVVNKIFKKTSRQSSISISEYLTIYFENYKNLGFADNTIINKKTHINVINKHIGNKNLFDLTVMEVNEMMEKCSDTMSIKVRTTLINMYELAKSQGVVDKDFTDPAGITIKPKSKVKEARLSLDEFKIISSLAKLDYKRPWIYRSQLMALISGQRRTDISRMRFKKGADFERMWKDWKHEKTKQVPYSFVHGDYMHVIQQKTGSLLKLPLSLRLDCIGYSLRDVVNMCRDKTVSPYLFHHLRNTARARKGNKITSQSLSEAFRHYRSISGLKWDSNPPPFHGIRSLSSRLHEREGHNAQSILGHKNKGMTDEYLDLRGSDWVIAE